MFVCFVCCCTSLHGQINTDRPSQSESASTVPNNKPQFENGLQLGQTQNITRKTTHFLLPTSLIRVGLTKRIELRIIGQFESLKTKNKTVQGFGDLQVGSKIQIIRNTESNTELAFLTTLSIPTGARGITSDKHHSTNKVSVTHTLTERSAITYNLGYSFATIDNRYAIYSLLYGRTINNKTQVFIETFGTVNQYNIHHFNVDAGITYALKNWIQLDAALATGINQKMRYFTIGCSILI